MAKDKIISEKPLIKHNFSLSSRIYSKPQIFLQREIDLRDYMRVREDEPLENGDIYFCGKVWQTTLASGHFSAGRTIYYRKKIPSNQPYIDSGRFERLYSNDILKDGDEFFNGKEWVKTGNIGTTVDTIYIYRRPIENFKIKI